MTIHIISFDIISANDKYEEIFNKHKTGKMREIFLT